jgi:hypothetical protein
MLNLDELIDLDDDSTLVEDPNPIDKDLPDPIEGSEDEPIVEPTNDDPEPEPAEVDEDAEAYYQYLVDNGVVTVPEDFEFDGTTTGINKALELTRETNITTAREELWNHLPDDFKPLLQYALMGGSSLEDYLKAYGPSEIGDADVSDPISQKMVLAHYFKTINPNHDDARIERMIKRLEEIGSLEEEAQDAVEYLKEMQEQQKTSFLEQEQARQDAEKAQAQQQITTLKTAIKESDLDNVSKNRVEAMLFNPNAEVQDYERKINSIYANPAHFVQFVNFLSDYDERKGFTYDRLKKKLKTESNTKFRDVIDSKLNNKKQGGGSSRQTHEDFDFAKFIGQ